MAEGEVAKLMERCRSLQNQLEWEMSNTSQLKRELSFVNSKLSEKDKVIDGLDRSIRGLSMQLESSNKSLDDCARLNEDYMQQLHKLSYEKSLLQSKLMTLEEELEIRKKESHKLMEMELEHDKILTMNSILLMQKEQLSHELVNHQSVQNAQREASSTSNLPSAKASSSKQQEGRRVLLLDVEEALHETADVSSEGSAAQPGSMLPEQLSRLDQTVSLCEHRLVDLQYHIEHILATDRNLRKENTRLLKEDVKLPSLSRQSVTQMQLDERGRDISPTLQHQLEEERLRHQREVEELMKNIETLKSSNHKLDQMVLNADQNLTNYKEKISQLTSTNAEYQSVIRRLELDLEIEKKQSNGNLHVIEQDLNNLKHDFALRTLERDKLTSQNKELELQISSRNQVIDKLKADLERTSNDMERLKAGFQEASKSLQFAATLHSNQIEKVASAKTQIAREAQTLYNRLYKMENERKAMLKYMNSKTSAEKEAFNKQILELKNRHEHHVTNLQNALAQAQAREELLERKIEDLEQSVAQENLRVITAELKGLKNVSVPLVRVEEMQERLIMLEEIHEQEIQRIASRNRGMLTRIEKEEKIKGDQRVLISAMLRELIDVQIEFGDVLSDIITMFETTTLREMENTVLEEGMLTHSRELEDLAKQYSQMLHEAESEISEREHSATNQRLHEILMQLQSQDQESLGQRS